MSDTFESNLIHKEILQNIDEDDIIICDVSGRNPNVFFELGIRMATQKPTVIVKDEKTAYPFDTGPNRYVGYPRDLRHPEMEKFKAELKKSIQATIAQDKDKSFIGSLGPFQVPDVESTTLPASQIILDRLDRIERNIHSAPPKPTSGATSSHGFALGDLVFHGKFGIGTVLDFEGDKVVVSFHEHGAKDIVARFLEKVHF